MSVIPLLSMIYIVVMVWIYPGRITYMTGAVLIALILLMNIAGFLIQLEYPRILMKLRNHISGIARGILPDKGRLPESRNSDDLIDLENGVNEVIEEMRRQLRVARDNQLLEQERRQRIEQQQQELIHAEKHRAMIQTLGAVCHHMGPPLKILRMRMRLMKHIDDMSPMERVQIEECKKELEVTVNIIERLRTIREFRTEPYTGDDDHYNDTEILAI